MHSNRSRLLAAFVLPLLISAFVCAPAFADSLAVKKAEAARAQAQVESLNTKAEIASEKYNAARARYNVLTTKVKAAERRIAKLEKQQRYLQSHLNTRVSEMYRTGPHGYLSVLLSVRSFEDFDGTARVLAALNQKDASTVAQLKASKEEVKKTRATLVAAQKDARRQKNAMAANAKAVETQLAARKRLLAGLTAEIQALVARRLAAQSSPEQARTMKLLLKQRTAATGGVYLGGKPSSQKAAAAVYYAEKEIGKPYVWAADGPDTFDCSGLMLFAYGKVGVELTHYSGQQIKEGKRVSRSNLQPGDLVFFGSPIHHVGMYVGGGAFLEAPYTGAEVRITRLSSRGDYAGACRP